MTLTVVILEGVVENKICSRNNADIDGPRAGCVSRGSTSRGMVCVRGRD